VVIATGEPAGGVLRGSGSVQPTSPREQTATPAAQRQVGRLQGEAEEFLDRFSHVACISKTYEDGEFEAFVERMKPAIQEVEQLAAVIPAKRR